MNPEFKPFSSKARRCSPATEELIHDHFSALEEGGALIREASRFTSPITVVSKSDGSPRICVDYTRLNAQTLPISFPLPNIQALPHRVSSRHRFFFHDRPKRRVPRLASHQAGIRISGYHHPKDRLQASTHTFRAPQRRSKILRACGGCYRRFREVLFHLHG